jgi:Flp pilus assembly protein TadD
MTTNRLRPMAFRFAVGSALGAALLAGTAYGDARAESAARDESAQLKRSDEKAVVRAEDAVAKSPSDAALRAALGQAYLRTGRFASATSAFTDAKALGDNDARTSLGLALANAARGNNAEAVDALESARGGLPASDYGLALALAGQTGRGVAVLADALRGGDNTPKLRQNLAYAYALNGSWREARIMMTQDVPGDQLDARMTQWVASGHPDLYQQRVAALLDAPIRSDPGVPERLALNAAPAVAQAAAEVPAAPAPVAELPAVERTAVAAAAPVSAPVSAPVEEYIPALSASSGPVLAEQADAPVQHTRSLAAFDEFARPVSTPLKIAPARSAAKPIRAVHAAAAPVSGGNHVVQLGSFSSEQNARRAWSIFTARNPELKDARMVITPAVVNGRNFWRVAAASYDNNSARGVCSSVKARGGACFAYTTTGPRANLLMARTELRSGGGLALAR